MKNFTKAFTILFLSVVMLSCENESIDNVEQTSKLIAIHEVYNNSFIADYVIDNGLNSEILYSSGNYRIQEFNNNLMTAILAYDVNNNLIGKTNFEYDAAKRLLGYSSYTIESGQEILNSTRSFEYVANKILSHDIYYDADGSISFTAEANIFTLNSNDEIIKFEDMNSGAVWEVTYDNNGNLTTAEVNGYGSKDGLATFIYNNMLVTESYQKERFRFGPKWKNNIMLYSQVGGYSFKQLALLGSNYLMSYSHLNFDGTNNVSSAFTYEFDNHNRLSKQTESKNFGQSLDVTISTYEYQ